MSATEIRVPDKDVSFFLDILVSWSEVGWRVQKECVHWPLFTKGTSISLKIHIRYMCQTRRLPFKPKLLNMQKDLFHRGVFQSSACTVPWRW